MIYHEESVNVEHTLISAKSHYENKLVNQIKEDQKDFGIIPDISAGPHPPLTRVKR